MYSRAYIRTKPGCAICCPGSHSAGCRVALPSRPGPMTGAAAHSPVPRHPRESQPLLFRMFHPLPLYIGLRYVRSRSQGFFVSFISWVSMAGICVGVAALITIISVMNGLEGEMRTRLLNLASHATLSGQPEQLRDWPQLADRIRREEGVVGVAPYIDLQGMLGRGEDMRAAMIRGVDPALEPQVSDIGSHMQ